MIIISWPKLNTHRHNIASTYLHWNICKEMNIKCCCKNCPRLFLCVEHGADLTATNNEGHTALSLAVGVGNKNGKCSFWTVN